MALFESESIVIRTYNLSEADRIVVFFTRGHGVVRGVAKGARRLRSKFGSSLEPFSTVNLTYFQKEDRELVSIQEAELVRSRFTPASDPAFLETFSYLSELLTSLVPPHDPSETIYRMIVACLDAGTNGLSDLAPMRLYFELWLLRLGGYLPSWDSCAVCSTPFGGVDPAWLRSDSHLLCQTCRSGAARTQVSPIHRGLFRAAQKQGPVEFSQASQASSGPVAEMSALMRRIVLEVIGKELPSERSFALAS